MSEEKNKTNLKDEDLKKVTGGGKLIFCQNYIYRDNYETCPNTAVKGKCSNCGNCSLNKA